MKKVLVVGAGVCGCACAYYLRKKGHEVKLIEGQQFIGGMAATHTYHGHPYEFGPHVWFWPHDDINDDLRSLTHGRLYDVERKLYSFNDTGLWRYPIHDSEIDKMPNAEGIRGEMGVHRKGGELVPDHLPKIGECSFEEYFEAAVGPTLYRRFMAEYTHKMWGIPGSKLDTKMVWADRMKDHYEEKPYDPIKADDHVLGKGLKNWYPMDGWNIVWRRMVEGCDVVLGHELDSHDDIHREIEWADEVIWTLHSDTFFGRVTMPAMGRLIIPFLLPQLEWAFPEGTESIHYSDTVGLTRTTEMKRITRHQSDSTLIVLEVPVHDNAREALPRNVASAKHFQPRCYNWQTDEAPNVHFCGRNGNFKYWGMPETVNAARQLVEERF
jgi:UDP-galactopyranose mutase